MEMKTNLKLNIVVFFSIYFLVSGADVYIILPTAWYYIRSLGLPKSFYGAVLAGQSLGFLLFSPVVGRLADKTRRIKSILLACVIVKVTANMVYAIPVSGFCPLVGTFFSGAANAAYGVMFGEIVRYTMPNESRSKFFILVDSMFTLCASCGPVFGSVVTFKANILGWNIDDGNSPGVVLASIWSVLLGVLIILPSKFGTEEICLTDDDADNRKPDTRLIKSLNSTAWCLFYVIFLNCLVACTSSGIAPLLAMELFHWKLLHTKLLFAAGMMFVFVVDLAVYIATTYYRAPSILVFIIILQIPSLLLLCCYAFLWESAPFIMSYSLVIFLCFGMPQRCFAIACSILSKITPSRHASSFQSFAVVVSFVAALVARGICGLVFLQLWMTVYSVALMMLCLLNWHCLASLFVSFIGLTRLTWN